MTAARYLLDTNICIYVARRKSPRLLGRFKRLRPGDAAISVITFGELHYGAAKSARRDDVRRSLEELASIVTVLPIPASAASEYGNARAVLEARGEPIGGNDLWIAAHALAERLILVTNNEREFRRVPGLALENWAT